MALYSSNKDKLTLINQVTSAKEKRIQTLVENNLKEVLDMHFLATEYVTTAGGRIDTLAVDNDGCPVIIEFKRKRDDNVINQSFSYLKWIQAQRPEFFEMLIIKMLGKEMACNILIDWRNPRIVCIAESFTQFDLDTVEVVHLRVDLFKYRLYEQNLFSLDRVNVHEYSKPVVMANVTMTEESNLGLIHAMKEMAGSSHAIRTLFDELRVRILALDEYVMEKPGKRHVAFRVTKNFAEIQFHKDKLTIELREAAYDDPRGRVENIREGYAVSLNRRIELAELRDLDYVFSIVEQSYKSVL
jgi:predicted transport protein